MALEEKYYDLCEKFDNHTIKSDEQTSSMIKDYFKIFNHQIKHILPTIDFKSIKGILEFVEFSNGKMFWLENNMHYKDYNKYEMFDEFINDVTYSSDRPSMDRLLRGLWMLKKLLNLMGQSITDEMGTDGNFQMYNFYKNIVNETTEESINI